MKRNKQNASWQNTHAGRIGGPLIRPSADGRLGSPHGDVALVWLLTKEDVNHVPELE